MRFEKTKEKAHPLNEVVSLSLENWHLPYELDTAAIFDKSECCLIFFHFRLFKELECG